MSKSLLKHSLERILSSLHPDHEIPVGLRIHPWAPGLSPQVPKLQPGI